MINDPVDLAERALQRRKREEGAMAVPALGCLLLVSPLLNVFVGADTIFGVPASFAYVFAVWSGLIILTFVLARRLSEGPTRR